MNNIHAIFTSREEGFKYKIRPCQKDVDTLDEAKRSVKKCLKENLKAYLEYQGIYRISPKFRIQGSWAYRTCNAPAKQGQEMDIDYGVYLPVSAFNGFDSKVQSDQAKEYFEAIESTLTTLCYEKGWELDNSKSSCIRIKIQDNAHMDIPLYAVPDDMFDAFKEKEEIRYSSESLVMDSINEDWVALSEDFVIYSEESLQDMNIRTIHMARRDGSWQSSDCEIIRQWFDDRLAQESDNGRQLRNICRYLKAWRDWVFDEKGAPSSILLMIIACKHYKYEQCRDDLALLHILEKLAGSLNGSVYENIKEHEDEDFNRMEDTEREKAKIYADYLYRSFSSSLNSSNKEGVLQSLIGQWGERIPNNPNLIKQDPYSSAPLVQSIITPQPPLRQG